MNHIVKNKAPKFYNRSYTSLSLKTTVYWLAWFGVLYFFLLCLDNGTSVFSSHFSTWFSAGWITTVTNALKFSSWLTPAFKGSTVLSAIGLSSTAASPYSWILLALSSISLILTSSLTFRLTAWHSYFRKEKKIVKYSFPGTVTNVCKRLYLNTCLRIVTINWIMISYLVVSVGLVLAVLGYGVFKDGTFVNSGSQFWSNIQAAFTTPWSKLNSPLNYIIAIVYPGILVCYIMFLMANKSLKIKIENYFGLDCVVNGEILKQKIDSRKKVIKVFYITILIVFFIIYKILKLICCKKK